jgi:hypothetical protein
MTTLNTYRPLPAGFLQNTNDRSDISGYDEYDFTTRWWREEGQVVLRLQGPAIPAGPSVRVARSHSRIAGCTVDLGAVRRGCPPSILDPEFVTQQSGTFAANLVLIEWDMAFVPVFSRGDGLGKTWAVGASYNYICLSPINLNDGIPTGVFPWDINNQQQFSIFPGAYFNPNLLSTYGYGNPQTPTQPVSLKTDPNSPLAGIISASQQVSSAVINAARNAAAVAANLITQIQQDIGNPDPGNVPIITGQQPAPPAMPAVITALPIQ